MNASYRSCDDGSGRGPARSDGAKSPRSPKAAAQKRFRETDVSAALSSGDSGTLRGRCAPLPVPPVANTSSDTPL